jgi:hypothetical protein
MRAIRYAAYVLACCLVFYLAALAVATVYINVIGSTRVVDAEEDSQAIYGGVGPPAIIYGRRPLLQTGPELIVLGASDALVGLRPPELSSRLGGMRVHNLSLNSGRMADFETLVSLAYEIIPPRNRRNVTFVIGVFYGNFYGLRDSRNFGDSTILDAEAHRFGLYAGSGHSLRPRVPRALLPTFLLALRPIVIASESWHDLTSLYSSAIDAGLGIKHKKEFYPQALQKLPEAERRKVIMKLRLDDHDPNGKKYVLDPGRLQEMVNLAQRISAEGSRLIVVDLPIPSWHADEAPNFHLYQWEKRPYFSKLSAFPHVYYVNMQDGFADETFYDSTHPFPNATAQWAARLSTAIAPILRERD